VDVLWDGCDFYFRISAFYFGKQSISLGLELAEHLDLLN
jgi:hypothetical protein